MMDDRQFRFGIFSWFGFRHSLDERMRMIKAAGFSATSVWLGRPERLVHEGREDEIPPIVRSHGLELEYIHASYVNCNKLWSESAADRTVIRKDYLRDIAYCARHHIPTLVVHISKGLSPPTVKQSGLDVVSDLVKAAEDSGVCLAVENTRQPDHLGYILQNIDSPHLGFCYDSSHDFLVGSPAGELLRKWGRLLRITHFSDNDARSDRHWLPGTGTGKWEQIAQWFPYAVYTGYLTLEVLPTGGDRKTGEEFLRDAHARLTWLADLFRHHHGERLASRDPKSSSMSRR